MKGWLASFLLTVGVVFQTADLCQGTRVMTEKIRLIVLTDISSLTAGVREPDDGQSLIRLMLYANEFDIEGLIASSNMGHGQVVRPQLIRDVIKAYEKVRPNLLLHSDQYPTPQFLRERVKAGQHIAGPKIPVSDSIGEGKDTEASDWIIRVVDKPDARPVWVTIWGGSADLAQALWKVSQTRKPAEVAAFVSKLRVRAVGDQDSTGAWIKSQFPDLFYITSGYSIRGMYRGGDTSLVSPQWVETHIRSGHGALGALYPNYNGGDIWSHRLGAVRGIKEGDTPSFLFLLPNGLSNPQEPSWGSWGGRFERTKENVHQYIDARDDDIINAADPAPEMATVYRWRSAFQADFQARLDWCVQPYAEANHPPIVHIRGEKRRTVAPGEAVVLDASESSGPNGDALSFEWTIYPQTDGTEKLTIENSKSPIARLIVPSISVPQTVHVLLTVQDNGSPALSRYGRVVLTVDKKEKEKE